MGLEPRQIGGLLLFGGATLMILGLLLFFCPRNLSWLGHLPGDLRLEFGKGSRLYIPLGTSLLISLVLSLLLTLFLHLLRLLGR